MGLEELEMSHLLRLGNLGEESGAGKGQVCPIQDS